MLTIKRSSDRSIANKTWQIKLTNEINFRNVLKVSRNTIHAAKISRLLTMYNEIGVLEEIFKKIHQASYRLDINNRIRSNEINYSRIHIFKQSDIEYIQPSAEC